MKKVINVINIYKKHFKAGFFYTVTSLFSTFTSLLAGFLVLRWVGPEEMGIWQLLLIINNYAIIGNLGVNTGLGRELPFLLGKGEEEKAFSLASTAKAYCLFSSIITLLITICAAVIFYLRGSSYLFIITLIVVGVILSVNYYKEYILTLFRTNKAFNNLSYAFLFQGAVNIFLVPIIYFNKFQGFLLYNLITIIISLLVLLAINPIRVKSRYSKQEFKILIKTGMPLFVMSYMYGVSKTFIKFAILKFGGVEMLGLFSPVLTIRNSINTLPKIISQYIYPKFTYKIGVSGDSSQLWKPVKHISFMLLAGLGLIVLPIYYYMPELLELFFPKYIDSLFPSRMALLSGIIFSSFIGVITLNSIKGYKERLIISVIYLLVSALIPFLLPVYFTNKIEGLAYSILIIDIIYFAVAYFITKRKLLNTY
ncbi:MAG: hypothetical protein IPM71_08805 [Bacteroidota bacterium]|nr:MAG: hypothetical protein IPM71_08805 [Bacteroidota bacterium]